MVNVTKAIYYSNQDGEVVSYYDKIYNLLWKRCGFSFY